MIFLYNNAPPLHRPNPLADIGVFVEPARHGVFVLGRAARDRALDAAHVGAARATEFAPNVDSGALGIRFKGDPARSVRNDQRPDGL